MLDRDASLVESGGIDQVADGLGLRQIDTSVEKRAQSELAGFGEARAGSGRGRRRRAGTTGEPWQEISTTSSAV